MSPHDIIEYLISSSQKLLNRRRCIARLWCSSNLNLSDRCTEIKRLCVGLSKQYERKGGTKLIRKGTELNVDDNVNYRGCYYVFALYPIALFLIFLLILY